MVARWPVVDGVGRRASCRAAAAVLAGGPPVVAQDVAAANAA